MKRRQQGLEVMAEEVTEMELPGDPGAEASQNERECVCAS